MDHVFAVFGQVYVYAIIWLALGVIIVGAVLTSSKALVRSRRRYVSRYESPVLGGLISGPIFGAALIALALSYRLLGVGADGSVVPTPAQVVANSVTVQAGITVTALVWLAALAITITAMHKRRNDTDTDLPGIA